MSTDVVNRKVRPWRVCQRLTLENFRAAGEEYFFIAEEAKADYVMRESIPIEMFSRDLQAVDTSNSDSVLKFCLEYGLVYSPMYPSKRRGLLCRQNKFKTLASDLDHDTEDEVTPDQMLIYAVNKFKDSGITENRRYLGSSSLVDISSDGLGISSYGYISSLFLGSEYARELKYRDRKFGAVVGLDEVKVTLRQFQVAMILVSAYEAGLRGNKLIEYLYQKNVFQKNYLSYGPMKDLFIGPAFEAREPKPVTLDEVLRTAANAPDGSDYSDDLEAIKQIHKGMEELLIDDPFEAAYQSAASFLDRSLFYQDFWDADVAPKSSGADARLFSFLFAPKLDQEGSFVEALLADFNFVWKSEQGWYECKR